MSNQYDKTLKYESISLPEPSLKGEMTILKALQLSRTERNISSKKIPLKVLSNLLWAAFGINRKGSRLGRTAPSASNSQEIDLYIVLREGVYLYDALHHILKPIKTGDYREMSGRGTAAQRIGVAPVNIIYVADLSRYDLGPNQPDPHIGDPEVQKSYYYTDTGFIAQNVYLYAASEGLAAWFHNCPKATISKELSLRNDQLVLFAHTVGYPENRRS